MDLHEVFVLLAEYDTEVPQAEQISLLHEKIMTDKAEFNAATITMLCRILGLTALNSLLQYVNWLVWEVCSVN